ncbi:MAG: HIT family protein [Cryomorphaceae bacterium]|nr:HIT family protein [Cryomorphaceae bacterium]
MTSIFTKIIRGEIPAHVIAQNEHAIAFMDIRPVQNGHVLVVPKLEVDKLFHLDENAFHALWDFARKIALAIEQTVPCNRVGITVYGLEVPHAHIHLIPINREGDMDFRLANTNADHQKLAALAKEIKLNYDKV